jgi:hypothetical protein
LAAKRKGFMEKERNFQRPLKKSEQCVAFFGFSAFYLLVWLLALFFRLFASSLEKIPSVNATTNGFYVKKHFTLPPSRASRKSPESDVLRSPESLNFHHRNIDFRHAMNIITWRWLRLCGT